MQNKTNNPATDEVKIKTFSNNKRKIKKCVAISPILQEVVKEVIQLEEI